MERTHIKITLLSGIIFLVCAVFLSRLLFIPISVYDEGLILCGASRVLRGDLPYKSFWSMYAPGQYYSLAFLFNIFGESVLVVRLWDIGVRSFLAFACFWLIRRNCHRLMAVPCGIAITIWLWFMSLPGYPVYPFLLCLVLCVLALMTGVASGSTRSYIIAALLAGLSMLFRYDMGLLSIMAISISLFAMAIRSQIRQNAEVKFRWHSVFIFLFCAAAAPVIVYGSLILSGCGPDMWQQLILDPQTMTTFRDLPFSSPIKLFQISHIASLKSLEQHLIYRGLGTVVLVVLCISSLYSAIALGFKQRLHNMDHLVIILTGVGWAMVPQLLVRSDFEHHLPLTIVSIIISYVLVAITRQRYRWASYMLAAMISFYWFIPLAGYSFRFSGPIPSIPQDLQQTVHFLKDHNEEGGSIYVGVENHDRFVINEPAVYFFSGAKYGTKYHELQPGIATTKRVQEAIIKDLVENNVNMVVLTEGWWYEPNLSSQDQGVQLLDRFIESNYTTITNYGEYRILSKQ